MSKLLPQAAGRTQKPVPADVFGGMVEVRRDLHRNPELSWQESRTAGVIEARLDELGIAHRRICSTGVVADLPGPNDAPLVMLRADIDALPIQEHTGLPYASIRDGVMHACGHDGHTSMVLGAADLLRRERPLPVRVRLLFQPAEERGNGAERCAEAGALEGVSVAFSGHIDGYRPVGTILVTEGVVAASSDAFEIRVSGLDSHAARPHEAVDAVVAGSHIVQALQSIVAREVDPADPAVITIGKFTGGTVGNAIAAEAVLEGTVRAYSPEVREALLFALRRVASAIADQHRAKAEVELLERTPLVQNTPEPTAIAREAAVNVVGHDRVAEMTRPNMAGEDFGAIQQHVPGCYVRFGARRAGGEPARTHSAEFTFDEDALAFGAAWFAEVVRKVGSARGG